ncbi:MAG: Gfo/Idh/MocA family oxidoreductase [Flavipsychrobacter sp.]|nr:Gfo/Idh/MocA family oxidoreductase [Flavipsychrobacter sp.]
MPNPIKTGILSYGMSGKLFQAPFLSAHNGFQLIAAVERSVKKIHTDYPNVISYPTIDELIADPNIELVVVNTPSYTHYDYALKALQAGKHVLIEKPFTVTVAQAETLFKEAQDRGVHVLPYQNRRFDSDYLSVKEVLDSCKLGRIVEAYFRYDRYQYTIGPKAFKETPVPGSGLLYDLGPHTLDAVFSLFGLPLHWEKSIGRIRPHTQVDDYTHIHLWYPNDMHIFVTLNMTMVEPLPGFIVNGTEGNYVKYRVDTQQQQLQKGMHPSDSLYGIEEPGKEGILTTINKDGTIQHTKIAPVQSSYIKLFQAVYDTIRSGSPYFITNEQVLKQLEILEG